MLNYVLIGIGSVVLSCIGQLLLKLGARKTWPTRVREYLNIYVLGGYLIMGVCMLVTIYVYTGLQLKYGAVLESLGYVIILLMSRLLLGEPITRKKLAGNMLIVIGILLFNLEWFIA